MKIACVGYRDWALKIYDEIQNIFPEYEFFIIRRKSDYNEKKIVEFQPDRILFYGWSDLIHEKLITRFKCIMLHPAPLPKYRGGSPIQNQIINGETISAVTLFLMDSGIDTGDIILQEKMSLEGHLSDIFERIIKIGIRLTTKMLNNDYTMYPQDNLEATFFKRRKPSESEITLEEFQNKNSQYLYNKIRMLEDPYPNAFIRTMDGKKLLIKLAEISG
jgi:methionyl-tRNA formyltransferase